MSANCQLRSVLWTAVGDDDVVIKADPAGSPSRAATVTAKLAPMLRRSIGSKSLVNPELPDRNLADFRRIANTGEPDIDDLLCDQFRYWIVSINQVKQAQGAFVGQVEALSFLRRQLAMFE